MGLLRRTIELASRGRVLRLRLPGDLGACSVYVTPDAELKYWKRNLEDSHGMLLNWARHIVRPGDAVWDIGANCGVFAAAAAATSGSAGIILAVEPDELLAGLIRKTSVKSFDGQIKTLCCAISEDAGVASFIIAGRGRASNHLASVGRDQAGGMRLEKLVPILTLDQLKSEFGCPDVIKIDVEGAELAVLLGGKNMISECRPAIICEVGQETAAPVSELMRSYDYAMFDASVEIKASAEIDRKAENTLFVAREKIGQILS